MTTATAESVALFLEESAKVLETRGVTKGVLTRYRNGEPGRVCSLGAMRVVATGYPEGFVISRSPRRGEYEAAHDALRAHIYTTFPDVSHFDSIPSWNDKPNRKPSTIIKAFKDAAAKVRAGVISVD